MAKLLATLTILEAAIALTATSRSCPSNILQVTLNQTEYFPGDKVNITCLQNCETLPLFCQPSLFYGTSEIMVFPETSETEILVNNCRYYRYTLNNLNTTELAGHNITCGWRLRGGSYSVSDPPVTILVEPANFRRPLPLLIVEQTPTALLIDGHRDKFEIVPIKSLTYPHVFFDNGLPPQRPSLRRLKHDRSNIEVVEIHTANCTTDGNLSVTCTHPAVLSNVSLAVDGIVQFSNESNTGVTYFSLPHNSITNSSASCRVNHSSGIHTSVLASLQPLRPCPSKPSVEGISQVIWITFPTTVILGVFLGCSILVLCILSTKQKSRSTAAHAQDKNCPVGGLQVQTHSSSKIHPP